MPPFSLHTFHAVRNDLLFFFRTKAAVPLAEALCSFSVYGAELRLPAYLQV